MKTKFKYDYDSDADVLYASIGDPRIGVSEEPLDGILIRRDAITGELIGFTIINYSRQKKDGYLKEIPYFGGVDIPY